MSATEVQHARSTGTSCPVCRSPSTRLELAPGWGEWRTCPTCSLEFVHPLELPETPEKLYGDAYEGKRRESNMHQFNDRVAARRVLVDKDPTLWFFTPAFDRTLEWLDGRVGTGSTVFEIGCGLGFVLHSLRRRGYEAVGLDVAELPVELNRADGFRVWHGTVDTLPHDFVEPDAVVAFFMLHHLTDPIGFLRRVRSLYPEAPLSLAQYGPSNRLDAKAASPPRTLTRWSADSLGRALQIAGYDPQVTEVSSTGNEWKAMQPLRKILKRTIVVPSAYRVARQIEHSILPHVLAPVRRDAYVVHALAEPVVE